MSKLSNVKSVSFRTGVMTAAGSYPAGGSDVVLPAGALVLRAHLSEMTALAGGTNVKVVCGEADLMSALATGSIADYTALTLTANKITAPGALKIVSTGTYSGGSDAIIHLEYVTEADE
mgnify:CR=1|jgi:hypothetical protein|tara:strand:+ start:1195 stop:1551 length:357 start_codon:yes stop_codon:yes gene_type:complete